MKEGGREERRKGEREEGRKGGREMLVTQLPKN